MFKLDLEKLRNQRSNCQHCCITEKAREFHKNICFHDCFKVFDCVDHNKLWKVLKGMGIPDHLTCLLRNLYAGQEATVRNRHETMDWFKTETGVRQGYILPPCLFNFYAEYIMWNARLDESQAGIKHPRTISNLRWYHSKGRKWMRTKEKNLWKRVKKEWKSWHLVPSVPGR